MRCDVRNAFCLCRICHTYFEAHQEEFEAWVETTWAAPFMEELNVKANKTMGQKVDWDERCKFLRRIIKGEISLAEARQLEI